MYRKDNCLLTSVSVGAREPGFTKKIHLSSLHHWQDSSGKHWFILQFHDIVEPVVSNPIVLFIRLHKSLKRDMLSMREPVAVLIPSTVSPLYQYNH